MLLEKLELFGFKSFAQRTTLRFAPGITAVVGPNGCGKSNISDAIRWALGEQNVRNLRGKQLLDVIFKGTREAKPMGIAEVALHLDNRDQRLATEYGQVSINRRAFRSGESEFRINKTPCRLRDIRDLFMDTGLGSAEYAVIEREMIDEVLADRDNARRFLLDEASGITRYKQRRKETLRKIEAVDADLVRVEDALEIEEREVRSLAYQMGKARRYRRLTEGIRDLDVALARLRWRELAEAASGETGRLSEEERQRKTFMAAAHRREAEQEQLRIELIELNRKIVAAHSRLNETESLLANAREEVLVRKERIRSLGERTTDLERRIIERREAREQAAEKLEELGPELVELAAQLEARQETAARAEENWTHIDKQLRAAKDELTRHQQMQIEQVRRRSASDHRLDSVEGRVTDLAQLSEKLDAQSESFRERAADLAQEIERITARRTKLEQELCTGEEGFARLGEQQKELQERLSECSDRAARLGEEEARHDSRLHVLEEQSRSYEGYRESVAELLGHRKELPGVLGVASELLTISPEWEDRLAPALRELTEWVVTDSEEAAWGAIAWLRERGLGQVTFFPLRELKGMQRSDAVSADSGPDSSSDALPSGAVTEREKAWAPLASYVRRMIIPVAKRAEVPPIAGREAGKLWVTEAGEVLAAAGWLSAGAVGTPEERLWKRPGELEQLRGKIDTVAKERERLATEMAGAREELKALSDQVASGEQEAQEKKATLGNLTQVLVEREAERRLVSEEITRLADEADGIVAQQAQLQEEIGGLRAEHEKVSVDAEASDEQLRAISAGVEELAVEKDAAGKTLTERKMEELWAQTRLRDVTATRDQHEAGIAEALQQISEMEQKRHEAQDEVAEATRRVDELRASEVELVRTKESRTQEADRLGQERTRLEDRLSTIEQELRQKRRVLSELETALRENEVRLARVEAEKERLCERILEQYQVDLGALEQVDIKEVTPGGAEADTEVSPPGEPIVLRSPEEELGEMSREDAAAKLKVLRRDRDRLGPVNVLAIEEHERKKEHVHFIKTQRDDLLKSKESLLSAIQRIDSEARRLFSETFVQVEEHFVTTFGTLFPGGEARLRLAGDDPLEADIEIMARPRGKRLESIRLLSSGERALTATALLFAVYLVKPSPFCVLDEVDAPLDDANIERFVNLLRTFSDRTQFIVITHNKLTMETADTLYGVTMQEPGISKVVSVRLEGGQIVTEDRAAADALAGMGSS